MGSRHCFGLLLLVGFTFATVPALSPEHDDFGIWDGPEEHPQNFLLSLCDNYDLYVNNEKIDCYATQLVRKSLLWDDNVIIEHAIWKREVDDQLEGSGSLPEPLPVEAPAGDERQINNEGSQVISAAEEALSVASEDKAKAVETESQFADRDIHPFSEVNATLLPVNNATESPVDVPSHRDEETQGEDKIQIPDAEKQPLESGISSEPKEDNVEPVEEDRLWKTDDTETKVDAEKSVFTTDREELSEAVKEPKEKAEAENSGVETDDIQLSEGMKEPAVEKVTQVDNQDVPAAEANKPVEEKPVEKAALSPFAVASLDTSNAEKEASDKELSPLKHETHKSETPLSPLVNIAETTTAASEKESESLDNKQSGSAVLDKEPQVANPSSVEGSDIEKHLSALSASSSSNNEPNAGESAENVLNRGKDATILVVLFVVVLVIGAAAFTHHFIKKRKQKTEEIKTLRNGDVEAAKQPGDVEKGVEMKPLLNRNEKPVIVKEFSDTKKPVDA